MRHAAEVVRLQRERFEINKAGDPSTAIKFRKADRDLSARSS